MSDDATTDVIDEQVAAAATHGSFCPKMCTFACPVTAATGRDDAVPWSLHRTVADLADGRLPLADDDGEVFARLTACTGCLGCQVPCTFDQDVPAQVRAGRAALVAAGSGHPQITAAVDHVAAGRRPHDGTPPPTGPAAEADATVLLIAGCRDEPEQLAAAVTLLRAAGERVTVHVPEGCCGASLRDLGADAAATSAESALPAADRAVRTLTTDPHCLPSLRRAGHVPVEVVTHLAGRCAAGALRFPPPEGADDDRPNVERDGHPTTVTYHDPCLSARAEGTIDPPRALLASAGIEVVEPEFSGRHTACSGAGLGLELLDEPAAAATAARRVAELAAPALSRTGTEADERLPVVTTCAGARRRLTSAGATTHDLLILLAARLEPT